MQEVGFHQGLGAKTSLLLALGKAYARLLGIERQAPEIAILLGRGGTSGVGVRVSDSAGVVTDLGHPYPTVKGQFGPSSATKLDSTAAPGLTFALPDSWRIILVHLGGMGLHGKSELDFFRTHCPIPEQETRHILALFNHLQGALCGGDILAIHSLLSEMQFLGLKKREWSIQSHKAGLLRSLWEEKRSLTSGLAPMCLSSMGPTLFLLTDDPKREEQALMELGVTRRFYRLTRPSRSGVVIGAVEIDGLRR